MGRKCLFGLGMFVLLMLVTQWMVPRLIFGVIFSIIIGRWYSIGYSPWDVIRGYFKPDWR